jgi:hypothetical protein
MDRAHECYRHRRVAAVMLSLQKLFRVVKIAVDRIVVVGNTSSELRESLPYCRRCVFMVGGAHSSGLRCRHRRHRDHRGLSRLQRAWRA